MIRRSTWIVLVIFVVLVGLALYLQNREPEVDDQELLTQDETLLLGVSLDDIVGLRVLGSDGKIFYATRTGPEAWNLVQPQSSGKIDGVQLDSYMSQLLEREPLSRLEAGMGVEAVGLLTPTYSLRLTLVSGQERLLEVGNETPTASGFYLRVDNTDLIVVSKFNIQNVLDLLDNPPFIPTQTPEVIPGAADQGEQESTETPSSVP